MRWSACSGSILTITGISVRPSRLFRYSALALGSPGTNDDASDASNSLPFLSSQSKSIAHIAERLSGACVTSSRAKYIATYGDRVQSRNRVGTPWCCISANQLLKSLLDGRLWIY